MERTDTEVEIRELLVELDNEQEKVARRVATATEALKDVERKRAAVQETLQYYCDLHGIPYDRSEVDEKLRERFKKMSAKKVVIELARERGGVILVKDIARVLLRAALYAHERSANGSVYGMMNRNPELFEKIGPGRYLLREMHAEPSETEQNTDGNGRQNDVPVDWMPPTNQPIRSA